MDCLVAAETYTPKIRKVEPHLIPRSFTIHLDKKLKTTDTPVVASVSATTPASRQRAAVATSASAQ